VAEYEREFFRLSHYAVSLLSTSRERCKRFETSLKPSIRLQVIRLQVIRFKHNNFSELISQALELERIESETAPEKKKSKKTEKRGKVSRTEF